MLVLSFFINFSTDFGTEIDDPSVKCFKLKYLLSKYKTMLNCSFKNANSTCFFGFCR